MVSDARVASTVISPSGKTVMQDCNKARVASTEIGPSGKTIMPCGEHYNNVIKASVN
jgi:hypothetical protein